jgi:hypothetical protein
MGESHAASKRYRGASAAPELTYDDVRGLSKKGGRMFAIEPFAAEDSDGGLKVNAFAVQ